MFVSKYDQVKAFVTKDGSIIRELMHPDHHHVENQSVAEAVVEPGKSTVKHTHVETEEVYHITHGSGEMSLDNKVFEVTQGDTIVIRPGVVHHLVNDKEGELRLLCCCSPPYSHDDTILAE